MKKALSLILALVMVLSVFTVALAKDDHRYHFGWEQPQFDFDYDFGFDFDNDDDDHDKDHHQKPVTPTDAPNNKPEDDKNQQDKPENQQGQRPENPAQRPEGGTCTPGDENCPDREEPTVTETDIKDIFDAILQLKDKLFQNGKFQMPKSNDKFYIIGMIINEDGTLEFIYVEKGKEDKGEQRLPCTPDDVTNTDVTGTDLPDGMDFIELGDTDVDGRVSAKDALMMLKHSVKKALIEHEGQKFLADLNEDGVIDAKDALKALRKAVGKE